MQDNRFRPPQMQMLQPIAGLQVTLLNDLNVQIGFRGALTPQTIDLMLGAARRELEKKLIEQAEQPPIEIAAAGTLDVQ